MNREIEHNSRVKSAVITTVLTALLLLLLLISFSFETKKEEETVIEIAMNFGNTDLGSGPEEPKPSETTESSSASSSSTTEKAVSTETPIKEAVTETTTETRPTVSKEKNKTPSKTNNQPTVTPKPKGDAKGKNAIDQMLGGKGESNSSGQGNSNSPGNVGDPLAGNGDGDGIGENWKSRIPEPQEHDCTSSGVVVMKIRVYPNGNIKSVTPSKMYDACLVKRADELIRKYVRAYPAQTERTGTYRVNLK